SKSAAAALAASAALETGGSSNGTGRSFRGGAIRSRHSRSAARSPSFASSIALRVMVAASPSSRASTASVVLLRVPLSFPAGLPLFAGSKGISGIASVLHFQLSARFPARSSRQNRVLSNRTKTEHQGTAAAKPYIQGGGVVMTAHRGKFIAY